MSPGDLSAIESRIASLESQLAGRPPRTAPGNSSDRLFARPRQLIGSGDIRGYVPVGGIIAYSGTADDIPSNWHLCDGLAGTPNLIDTFIKGTNIAGIGGTGGVATNTPAAHSISTADVMAVLGDHNHGMPAAISQSPTTVTAGADPVDAVAFGTFPGTTDSALAGSGTQTPISLTHAELNNEPPFYKLAYIMRMS